MDARFGDRPEWLAEPNDECLLCLMHSEHCGPTNGSGKYYGGSNAAPVKAHLPIRSARQTEITSKFRSLFGLVKLCLPDDAT
jgi:hypothetical protein